MPPTPEDDMKIIIIIIIIIVYIEQSGWVIRRPVKEGVIKNPVEDESSGQRWVISKQVTDELPEHR